MKIIKILRFKQKKNQNYPSSIMTPFIRTLSDIRTFELIKQFAPITHRFNDVYLEIVAALPTAHSTICFV